MRHVRIARLLIVALAFNAAMAVWVEYRVFACWVALATAVDKSLLILALAARAVSVDTIKALIGVSVWASGAGSAPFAAQAAPTAARNRNADAGTSSLTRRVI